MSRNPVQFVLRSPSEKSMHPAREGSLVLSVTGPGADGSSAAPEFGIAAVVDRFSQIEPKLIFAADGYRFNGRDFDRRESLEKIVGSLPTLEHLVWLPSASGALACNETQPAPSGAQAHEGNEGQGQARGAERADD